MSEPLGDPKLISRRRALQLLGAASLAAVGWTAARPNSAARASEAVTGVQAALTRDMPPPDYVEKKGVSDQTLALAYDKYFQGKEKLVSKKSWMRHYGEGSPTEGIGRSLSKLASVYYEKQKKSSESFDQFYDRFLEELKKSSDLSKIYFHEYLVTLQISGENEAFDGQVNDINISRFQDFVVPISSIYGQDYNAVDSLRPYGLALQVSQKLNGGGYVKGTDRAVYDLIRARSEQTIGMMDYEGSSRAQALLLYGNPETKLAMVAKYPEVVRSYQKTLANLGVPFTPLIDTQQYKNLDLTNSTTEIRVNLQKLTDEYISKYSRRLDAFAEDPAVLKELGIDENNLDNWQKYNRTDIWYQLVINQNTPGENHEDERKAVQAMKQGMQSDYKNFRDFYYRNLISQQILNPRFLKILDNQAFQKGQTDEHSLINQIKGVVDKYQLQASKVRQSYYEIAREEGKYEYDMEFQTLASANLTKMLSEYAGSYDLNDPHNFYWHLYRFAAVREMSPNYIIVRDGQFAPDTSVDPPYERTPTLNKIDELVKYLMDKGMMVDHPSKHIVKFIQTIDAIKKGKFEMWPDLSEEDRRQVTEVAKILVMDEPQIPISRSQALVFNLINR